MFIIFCMFTHLAAIPKQKILIMELWLWLYSGRDFLESLFRGLADVVFVCDIREGTKAS